MIDPFTGDAFQLAELTQAVNLLPNNYGRVREMDIFPAKGVTSRKVMIDEREGVLSLLPTRPVGAPGTYTEGDKRRVRSLVIPHIPHDDVVMPSAYANVRKFGTENEVSPVVEIVNDKLQSMRNKHGITLEFLRMGALKGIILDADGSVLYNLYNEFGITQKVVAFAFGTTTTNIRNKCLSVTRHIDENLMGESYSKVHALCSQSFFEGLISHPKVEDVFKNWEASAERLGGDPRKGFVFGGITFEEYIGKSSAPDGTVVKFIKDGEAHAFPLGTSETFRTYFAPADFEETVNTVGLELYAKQEPRKFGRGRDIHTQSNPLPLCHRPGLLVKMTL